MKQIKFYVNLNLGGLNKIEVGEKNSEVKNSMRHVWDWNSGRSFLYV